MVIEWDYIFSYSRAKAIEDGVLLDVSELATECGFKVPVAITSTAWAAWVKADEQARELGESEEGRLWDTLWMLFVHIRTSKMDRSQGLFEVVFTKDGESETAVLKADIGPGDEGEPVLTIMLPEED